MRTKSRRPGSAGAADLGAAVSGDEPLRPWGEPGSEGDPVDADELLQGVLTGHGDPVPPSVPPGLAHLDCERLEAVARGELRPELLVLELLTHLLRHCPGCHAELRRFAHRSSARQLFSALQGCTACTAAERATAQGPPSVEASAAASRLARAELWRRPELAARLARRAVRLARNAPYVPEQPEMPEMAEGRAWSVLARALIEQGRLQAARRAQAAVRPGTPTPEPPIRHQQARMLESYLVTGVLRAAQGAEEATVGLAFRLAKAFGKVARSRHGQALVAGSQALVHAARGEPGPALGRSLEALPGLDPAQEPGLGPELAALVLRLAVEEAAAEEVDR